MNTLVINHTWDNAHRVDDRPMIEVELIYNDETPRRVRYERYSYPHWEYAGYDNEPIMSDEVTRVWHGEEGDRILNEFWINGSGSIEIEA